jgi:hypothetical protein
VGIGMGRSVTEPQSAQGKPPRGGRKWKFTLLGLVGVFVVLAAYDLVSVSGQVGTAGTARASGTPAATHALASAAPAAPAAAAPSSAAPPAIAALTPSPAPRPLPVASIAAFGPAGPGDGDNPGHVSRINEAGAQPWYSSWYASPAFGNLQPGTGLLLDMGGAVKLSGLRLVLGSPLGADVQVRVGNSATLAGLATVASATDVGGTVRLPVTSPVSGRYVLVWFTRLPPNGQPGQYQVGVYSVTLNGTASAGA